MDYRIELSSGKPSGEIGRKYKIGNPPLGQIAPLLVGAQRIVDDDVGPAGIVERCDNIRADKAGAAGHEDHAMRIMNCAVPAVKRTETSGGRPNKERTTAMASDLRSKCERQATLDRAVRFEMLMGRRDFTVIDRLLHILIDRLVPGRVDRSGHQQVSDQQRQLIARQFDALSAPHMVPDVDLLRRDGIGNNVARCAHFSVHPQHE